MSKQPRRHFSADEKVKILRLHLLEGKAVSSLCEEYGLVPSLFYTWQKVFFEQGRRAFEGSGSPVRTESKLQKQITHLEQRLARKHEVLSELMEEHIRLKKALGESCA
jgi:transposase-like protein